MNRTTWTNTKKFIFSKKMLALLVLFLFVLSLIPLVALAPHCHPLADDFSYGINVKEAWTQNHSLSALLQAAGTETAETYQTWQGTYSAIFLMALQPAVFGDGFYSITPLLLIGFLIGGNLFLAKVLLRNYLHTDRAVFCIISLAATGFMVQAVPFPSENFFWYNGGILYTFFYALALFLFGFILLMLQATRRRGTVFYCLMAVLSALLVGGGNFSTALTATCVLFFFVLFYLLKKSRKAIYLGIVFIFLLASFSVNVLAPGNTLRQTNITHSPSFFETIFDSFFYSFRFLLNYVDLIWVLLVLLTVVLLYPFLSRSSFSFRLPGFAMLLSYCLYAAQFAPSFYAIGNMGPDRMQSIYYFSAYLLLLFNTVYLTGWVASKINASPDRHILQSGIRSFAAHTGRHPLIIIFALVVLLCCTSPQNLLSVKAVRELYNGNAAIYEQEYQQRLAVLEGNTVQDVVFPPYSRTISLFKPDSLKTDETDWANRATAQYYQKSTIRIEEEKG